MARKAIVDRNTVLQLLKEGKTSQTSPLNLVLAGRQLTCIAKNLSAPAFYRPQVLLPYR